MNISEEIAGHIATAVRTLATTASSHLGTDCIWHAMACQHLLAREGIDDARLVAGYAAWRVDGHDPGAVVCHHVEGSAVAAGSGGFLFHAWVSCGNQVFDATTYQFRGKLAELDAADGGRTTVTWCPQFLLVDRKDCKPWRSVRDGVRAGLFCYEAIPTIVEQVTSHPDTQLDAEGIALLEQVYERVKDGNKLVVIGPCGVAATE
ncbi:hypothetical protein [Lamprocystis purpurea]|jgi:hypothetical protein|uniref:hypothetical protein n=1 Tax=Lamprocystis purpurea TaxID=61598 RepID=UPI0003623E9D|nr:hypothetical protein [Lamprocystis purpurea]